MEEILKINCIGSHSSPISFKTIWSRTIAHHFRLHELRRIFFANQKGTKKNYSFFLFFYSFFLFFSSFWFSYFLSNTTSGKLWTPIRIGFAKEDSAQIILSMRILMLVCWKKHLFFLFSGLWYSTFLYLQGNFFLDKFFSIPIMPIFPYSSHILPILFPYYSHILPILIPYSSHILPIFFPYSSHINPILALISTIFHNPISSILKFPISFLN